MKIQDTKQSCVKHLWKYVVREKIKVIYYKDYKESALHSRNEHAEEIYKVTNDQQKLQTKFKFFNLFLEIVWFLIKVKIDEIQNSFATLDQILFKKIIK